MTNKRIYVFIPAYNEAGAISDVLEKIRVLNYNLKIFVIDDGSMDGTAEISSKFGASVIKHPINLGGGASIRTAFAMAIRDDVDYFVTMDGDGQH